MKTVSRLSGKSFTERKTPPYSSPVCLCRKWEVALRGHPHTVEGKTQSGGWERAVINQSSAASSTPCEGVGVLQSHETASPSLKSPRSNMGLLASDSIYNPLSWPKGLSACVWSPHAAWQKVEVLRDQVTISGVWRQSRERFNVLTIQNTSAPGREVDTKCVRLTPRWGHQSASQSEEVWRLLI